MSSAAAVAALAALSVASIGSARAKPKCFGKTATQVGTNRADTIVAKPRAVVVARGGNDTITVGKGDHTRHVICGGPGDDRIKGGTGNDRLIGGPSDDLIKGANGDDLIVGDDAKPDGDANGPTGKDDLNGSGGADFVVGDNRAANGNASGASRDDLRPANGNDVVIGDSASLKGNATGGADDRMGGASGDDLVVGDSYAVSGVARGGGDDDVNGGPGKDLEVGDGYTKTGSAIGSGSDGLSAADGGDFDATCRPANSCADVFYGDNYRAACAENRSVAANAKVEVIRCVNQNTDGGRPDLLNSDQGDDFMNGGLPHPDDIPGSGDTVDRCDGGTGTDTATSCKEIRGGFERELPFPAA